MLSCPELVLIVAKRRDRLTGRAQQEPCRNASGGAMLSPVPPAPPLSLPSLRNNSNRERGFTPPSCRRMRDRPASSADDKSKHLHARQAWTLHVIHHPTYHHTQYPSSHVTLRCTASLPARKHSGTWGTSGRMRGRDERQVHHHHGESKAKTTNTPLAAPQSSQAQQTYQRLSIDDLTRSVRNSSRHSHKTMRIHEINENPYFGGSYRCTLGNKCSDVCR